LDDTFKTFAKDDGRKFVLEPMFEILELAAISGLASGTASGGGGAGRGCQRRLESSAHQSLATLDTYEIGSFSDATERDRFAGLPL
jgi:hypothetical protein